MKVVNGHLFLIAEMTEGFAVALLRGEQVYWVVLELRTAAFYFARFNKPVNGYAMPAYTAERIDDVVDELGADMERIFP